MPGRHSRLGLKGCALLCLALTVRESPPWLRNSACACPTIAEPHELMLEDGHDFSHPPSLEDFEAQLALSLQLLSERRSNAVFDRCPLDLIAYLSVHPEAEAFDIEDWRSRVHHAVQTLNFLVFVPIEEYDRIVLASAEFQDHSRGEVDEALRELLIEDSLDLGVEVLEVEGRTAARVNAVLQWFERRSS